MKRFVKTKIRAMKHHAIDESLGKTLKSLSFLVPACYVAIMSLSISPSLFRIDDLQEFGFVAESDSFLSLLGSDAFQLFRPVKNLFFLAFSFLAPFGIRWCHFVNILVCAISFFPVRALCRRILCSEKKALLAASIWLFSPTLVSSAAWLSCVNILVMVAFAAGAVVLHDSAWDGNRFRRSRILFAGLCLFLSLLSYECAVAVAPLLVFFDFYLRPGRLETKDARAAYALYWTIVVLYFVLRHFGSARVVSTGMGYIVASRIHLVMSSPWLVVKHFLLWFWPFGNLFVLGSYRWGDVPIFELTACWGLVLFATGWCLTWIRKDSVRKICLLVFLIGFAPTSNCVGVGNGPFGDYYMGLASIGLSAWTADCILSPKGATGWRRCFGLFLAAVLVATRVWGVAETTSWAAAWGNGSEVIDASVRNHPEFFSNKKVLASMEFSRNHHEEALRLCREIEEAVGPDSRHMATVFALRGTFEMEVNHNADEAFRLFDEMLRVDPSEEKKNAWHFNRGRVFEILKHDTEAAEREYGMAVSGKSPNLGAAHGLALLESRLGRPEAAVALWQRIVRIKPDDEEALWHLAMVARKNGDERLARKYETRALRIGGR